MPVLPFVVAGGLLTALLFAAGDEDKPAPKPEIRTPARVMARRGILRAATAVLAFACHGMNARRIDRPPT